MRTRTVLFSTIKDCNYFCKYCNAVPHENKISSHPRKSSSKMTISLVDAVFQALKHSKLAGYEKISIVWHGGEPLLMGINFFRNAILRSREILEGRGFELEHVIQTNLGLLNKEFISFFSEQGIQISTSLDLPIDAHAANRVNCKGESTYETTIKNINQLIEYRIPFGIVSVINNTNVKNPEIFYKAAQNLKWPLQLIHCCAGQTRQGINLTPSSADLANFYCKLFDYWLYDSDPVDISNFPDICKSILGVKFGLCYLGRDCTESIVAIDSNGDIWPCCSCIGHEPLKLGHIDSEDWHGLILGNSLHQMSDRHINLPDHCISCRNYTDCYGGCMCAAFEQFGSPFQSDPHCSAYFRLFEHARRRVHEQCGPME